MADYWTWAEIKAKVEKDLDLEGETFIPEDELLGYANEAIREVSRQIHTLYDDYFLTRSTITLASGTEEYSLPSDIYAMKVRGLVYRNGTNVWPIKRLKDWRKFEEYEFNKSNADTTSQYNYIIVNSTVGSPKILFTPTPNESGAYVRIWYIRNANELTLATSICDIPEAVNYVMQYMKVRCYEKEGHPNLQKALLDLAEEKKETLGVLATLVPDNDNILEMDTSTYEEMS
jgi:hypothetical protein